MWLVEVEEHAEKQDVAWLQKIGKVNAAVDTA
jgi:hypothetical protein